MMPNEMMFIAEFYYKGSLFTSSILREIHVVIQDECTGQYSLSAACAPPYIGIVRGLWEGDSLTGHRRPLARPVGMPSGHVAHASLRGDAWIHYYL